MARRRYYFVLGTRPEIVKLSPVIDAAKRGGHEVIVVHSGQHYDVALDRVFFEELALPRPSETLSVGSGSHGTQTGKIVIGVERVLRKRGVGTVVVEGDTNTTLGAALAAAKVPGVVLAHVESGCRSFNRAMPEETNRIVVDHLGDVLFAATPTDMGNLAREGLVARSHLVGSTGVEACLRHAPLAAKRTEVLDGAGLAHRAFALCTVHREENTANPSRLRGILGGLKGVAGRLPVVVPVHPRTAGALRRSRLRWPPGVHPLPPLGYLDFLGALVNAKLVLTDSGGVQEEAAVLGTRCFTLRDETEWTYTVEKGANALVGTSPQRIAAAVDAFLDRNDGPVTLEPVWPTGRPPSESILDILEHLP